MRRTRWSLLLVLIAGPALAQTGGTYLLTSSNPVSPFSPTTTISIWAAWTDPGDLFMFAGADYDLTAGDGQFSNPVNVLNGPGSSTGVIAGNVISGARNGQLTIPCFCMPLLGNPMLLATYEWTTTNFTPRSVSLDTSNTANFIVAWILAGPGGMPPAGTTVQLFPHEFTPGSGVINVVPAPAAWFVLALPLVAATRRRQQ